MGKHRDSKGRALRSGESQRENGQYMYRYTDCDGNRRTVYSWRLVASDRTPAGKKDSEALRELEKKRARELLRARLAEREREDQVMRLASAKQSGSTTRQHCEPSSFVCFSVAVLLTSVSVHPSPIQAKPFYQTGSQDWQRTAGHLRRLLPET